MTWISQDKTGFLQGSDVEQVLHERRWSEDLVRMSPGLLQVEKDQEADPGHTRETASFRWELLAVLPEEMEEAEEREV